MDQGFVDWSSLSKKERKRLIKERKREEMQSNKKRGGIVKWFVIVAGLAIFAWGVMWFINEASKPMPGLVLPDQGRDHVSEKEWGKFKYNSNPPTSGPHDEAWTKAGVYSDPQGDGHLVHSLEHGYVIISHNCEMNKLEVRSQKLEVGTQSAEMNKECMDFVGKLKDLVNKDSWKLILVPRSNLDTNFALTAWTRIDKFKTEDASMDRVNSFISSLRNHGPEQTME